MSDAVGHVIAVRLADLTALSPYTNCVRTYSVDQGLGAVPAIAAEFGKRVLLGVWIGQRIHISISERLFRRLASGLLGAIGLMLLIRHLG